MVRYRPETMCKREPDKRNQSFSEPTTKVRKNTLVRIIKQNDRSEPKRRTSKDHLQRISESQMKKTVESWVHEFKKTRSRVELRQAVAGFLTKIVSQG